MPGEHFWEEVAGFAHFRLCVFMEAEEGQGGGVGGFLKTNFLISVYLVLIPLKLVDPFPLSMFTGFYDNGHFSSQHHQVIS